MTLSINLKPDSSRTKTIKLVYCSCYIKTKTEEKKRWFKAALMMLTIKSKKWRNRRVANAFAVGQPPRVSIIMRVGHPYLSQRGIRRDQPLDPWSRFITVHPLSNHPTNQRYQLYTSCVGVRWNIRAYGSLEQPAGFTASVRHDSRPVQETAEDSFV